MPPQQSHGLLDGFDICCGFRAHFSHPNQLRGEPNSRFGSGQAANSSWTIRARKVIRFPA
jgi:hypothetical protein